MFILEAPAAMQAWSAGQHSGGAVVGLVPTMGDLHDGHLALIDAAVGQCDVVVVSIFVNPLQFNRRDDFDMYPRAVDDDVARCTGRGATAIYAPSQESMYPPGFQTSVEPGPIADPLEGAGRPGHFRGVATVVAKLFMAARPDVAVFGRKDVQQLAVVRQMVADLDMGIRIIEVDTVREPDGLAMSSRNRRLTADQRRAANVVPLALRAIADGAASRRGCLGPAALDDLRRIASDVIAAEPLARVEYVEIVDPRTLLPPTTSDGPLLAVAAVWFGDVRLIDNRTIR